MTVTFNDTAFPNGISSGDVTQTSAVLWTHAIDLGQLTFQISTDASFHHVVKSKKVSVTDSAVPVKVEFDHLKPGTEYFYRAVDADGHVINGSFATAASLGSHSGFEFGVFGDFSAQLAPFPAMSNADTAGLDLAIMLGDTVYADLNVNSNGQFVPVDPNNPTDTLLEFQARNNDVHSSHLGFNFLADLKATTPVLTSADDHEVIDNFAGGAPPGSDPRFDQSGDFINETQLFANGLKAFSQFNAIQDRTYSGTGEDRFDGAPDLYRYNTYGSDAAIIMVDQRSFRDPELFPGPNPNPPPIPFITQSFDPDRTLLGDVQLARLEQDLLDARDKGITWKFVMLQEPIQNFGPVIFPGDRYEGYAAERTALLKFIDDNHIENVVFVSSDSHWYSVNNLTYSEQPFGTQIQSSAIEVNTMAIGAPPIAPLIPSFLFPPGDPRLAFYNSLPNAPDPGDDLSQLPNDKDDFISRIFNSNMAPLGYDPIGLSSTQATLNAGDYFVGHDFGWTDFKIDPNGQLVVTTYGIPSYTPGQLADPNSGILDSTPQVVSQFTMNPTSNSIIGTAGNDQLNGTDKADVVLGADGNDKLNGQTGDDYVDGGKGNDQISGGLGNDHLFGRDGNDKLNGDDGNDQLTGGIGNDTAAGGAGDDRFIAEKGDGNDNYDGGAGSDTLDLSATSAPANVDLAKGSATSSDIGHDKLSSIENVIGSTGDDTITGDKGANRLDGGAGNDTLNGSAGNDVLIGGPGNDTFVFAQGFGMDTITGFTPGPNPGPHDIITFDHTIFADYTAVINHSAQIGADTVITADATDTITLTGVLKANLVPDDFSFV